VAPAQYGPPADVRGGLPVVSRLPQPRLPDDEGRPCPRRQRPGRVLGGIPVGHDVDPLGGRPSMMQRYRTGGTPWTIITGPERRVCFDGRSPRSKDLSEKARTPAGRDHSPPRPSDLDRRYQPFGASTHPRTGQRTARYRHPLAADRPARYPARCARQRARKRAASANRALWDRRRARAVRISSGAERGHGARLLDG
jgi:hypothetical protein